MTNREVRVAALRIPVRNLERSTSFYTDRLGLRIGRLNSQLRLRTLLPVLPHGPVMELMEADEVPPMHFSVKGGYFQPFIRLHASDLDGMFERLSGEKVTELHHDLPDDGCGKFFEVADPDGTWLQYHVNIGEPAIMNGTTEAVVNMEIPVSDVQRSAAFYESIGFTLDRCDPHEEVAFLSAGRFVDRFGYTNIPEFGIILTQRKDFPLLRFKCDDSMEPVMVLQTDDLEAYRSKLVEREIQVSDWRHVDSESHILVFDPDGHVVGVGNALRTKPSCVELNV